MQGGIKECAMCVHVNRHAIGVDSGIFSVSGG